MVTGQPAAKPKPLTAKQQRFIEEYPVDWNGQKAAERAGYAPKQARKTAYDLLHDVRVKQAIEKRMSVLSMSAAEAIAKLADWGRGNIAHFLKVDEQGGMSINLVHSEAKEHYHLIKKVKQTKVTMMLGDIERVEVKTEVELYDAKDAVHKILQIHGRYAPQKFDHTNDGGKFEPGSNIYVPDNGRGV